MKTIHLTTGDMDGIGLEVSLKALYQLGPKKGIQFVLWRSASTPKKVFNLIDKKFHRSSINEKTFQENKYEKKENILLDVAGLPTPTKWVVHSTKHCLQNKKDSALVTGPLSKTQMQKEKFKEKGHTDLLKNLSKTPYIFMTFLGEFFNVTLLTGHVPIKRIKWTEESLNTCIQLCSRIKKHISSQRNKKIAVLGFNPHAGEEGLLGKEEMSLKKEIKKWKNKVEGPLVPDVAFSTENLNKYFIYICLYHDQALIPFKMIHKRNSFQLSLGLPFIRTSVSHGTAKDICGKNKADPASMKKALLWAIHSLRKPI